MPDAIPSSAVSESAPVHAGQTTKSCLWKRSHEVGIVDQNTVEEDYEELENVVTDDAPPPAAVGEVPVQKSRESGSWTRFARSP